MNILSKTTKDFLVVDHKDKQFYVVKFTNGNKVSYSVYELTGGYPELMESDDQEVLDLLEQLDGNGKAPVKRRRRRTKAEIEASQ